MLVPEASLEAEPFVSSALIFWNYLHFSSSIKICVSTSVLKSSVKTRDHWHFGCMTSSLVDSSFCVVALRRITIFVIVMVKMIIFTRFAAMIDVLGFDV